MSLGSICSASAGVEKRRKSRRIIGHMRRIDGGFAMMPQTVYASQKYDQTGRRRLQACKLHLDLGGLPDISEPMPSKLKWKHRKRHQRICNQIQALEAQAKQTRFRT